jgi:hypothetical protein
VLYGIAIPPGGYVNHPRVRAIIASASLGVATNIMVTLLILLRLAITWFNIRKTLPSRKKAPPMYTDVTIILVESAAPLALFGICFITSTAINYLRPPNTLLEAGKSTVVAAVFDWLYYLFCVSCDEKFGCHFLIDFQALSPQMIIFRVTTGHSWRNMAESEGGTVTFSRPIQFAQQLTYHESEARVTDSNGTGSA